MHTTNPLLCGTLSCDKERNGTEDGGREEATYMSLFHHTLQKLNTLGSAAEERQVEEVLARLKVEVSQRRLLLYPYFRDFDRVRDQHSTRQQKTSRMP